MGCFFIVRPFQINTPCILFFYHSNQRRKMNRTDAGERRPTQKQLKHPQANSVAAKMVAENKLADKPSKHPSYARMIWSAITNLKKLKVFQSKQLKSTFVPITISAQNTILISKQP